MVTIAVSTNFATHADKPPLSLDTFSSHLNERVPTLMEQYDLPGVNIALIQGVTWCGLKRMGMLTANGVAR